MRRSEHAAGARRSGRILCAVLSVWVGIAALYAAEPSASTSPSASVNPAILNAPGYQPPADPESMSVVIGRRVNAPLVKMPFTGGTRSLDELGRYVCRALHFSSVDSLRDACITYDELSVILWPEFPQSRPITGLTADDAWLLLNNRNHGGIARALQGYGGRHLQFVRWERRDTIAIYKNFKLHHGLTLVVTNEDGKEEWLDVVRSVAERKGRFKLYSLKD
jgi:hypothetical protein